MLPHKFSKIQGQKADLPIEVTLSGILIEVKPVHPLKADSPIEVTSFIVTDVKDGLFLIN